jgi:hypothetical protein
LAGAGRNLLALDIFLSGRSGSWARAKAVAVGLKAALLSF